MKQKCAIIGSGVAGIASAIRLAAKGYNVSVFEKEAGPGGKLSQIHTGGFRFDSGPSLFTMPGLVTELFALAGEDASGSFPYIALDKSCRYFWEDGTKITAWQDKKRFAGEVMEKTSVPEERLGKFLDKSKRLYDITRDVFLFNSLHKRSNYLTAPYLRTLRHLHELDAFTTMHKKNSRWFDSSKMVQLFDRYATYNGSNPYSTPATLNIIPHLEHNMGVFFPKKGMYQITESLYELALGLGVSFHFNTAVEGIDVEGKKGTALRLNGEREEFDIIISDIDIVNLYRGLLPDIRIPRRQLSMERSSSAIIFYWGVKGNYPDLSLHNILFSDNYKNEFDMLFRRKAIFSDPTVYIFISSKVVKGDAPGGSENWYVMINAPEISGQDWKSYRSEARRNILSKIKRVLGLDIESRIVSENYMGPVEIEQNTGSFRGSLYGLSSNSRFSAFYRHPNFSRSIKNLYFTGGSVHPGGGIPLCLASAKIVDREIPRIK